MKVAILGGGLSAAFAYRACKDHGLEPDVFADRFFTPAGGNIWLHWLPDSSVLPEPIEISSVGTAATYAEKMWGYRLQTSFPTERHIVTGYPPLLGFSSLWNPRSGSFHVTKLSDADIRHMQSCYDCIIRTFPNEKTLQSRQLWKTPIWVVPDRQINNWVIYWGTPDEYIVRESQLFGFRSYEFPPISGNIYDAHRARLWAENRNIDKMKGARLWLAPEIPPETPPRSQWEDNVLYTGRFALFDRKFLSHQSYDHVITALKLKELANA